MFACRKIRKYSKKTEPCQIDLTTGSVLGMRRPGTEASQVFTNGHLDGRPLALDQTEWLKTSN